MTVNLVKAIKLLESNEPDYVELLQILCQLEREFGVTETFIKLNHSDNIKNLWKIKKVADSFNKKLSTKLEEVALVNTKSRNDLIKIIEINNAINEKIKFIIQEKWPTKPPPTD